MLSILLPAMALLTTGIASNDSTILVGTFSQFDDEALVADGWTTLKLGKKTKPTQYDLVESDGVNVVRAITNNTASGLIKRVDIDVESHPMLNWGWKISNTLEKGDVTSKNGDDFAARIYVTFDYDIKKLPLGERLKYRALRLLGYKDIPIRALNYYWANKAPTGTVTSNAYTNWVKMIAVRDTSDPLNTWQEESRDIYADYEMAFGEPPGRITGIAIMSDTDNTGESAMAYFSDIAFEAR